MTDQEFEDFEFIAKEAKDIQPNAAFLSAAEQHAFVAEVRRLRNVYDALISEIKRLEKSLDYAKGRLCLKCGRKGPVPRLLAPKMNMCSECGRV